MNRATGFFCSVSLLFLFACSTAQSLKSVDTSAPKWTGTGLLFIYDLDTTDAETLEKGCYLILSDTRGQGSDVEMSLPASKHSVLVAAPSSHYTWKKLSCPHLQRWDLGSLAKYSFQTVRSRMNYIGAVSFHFPKSGDEMSIVKMDAPTQARMLSQAMMSFPRSWESALVDPYTAKAIPSEALANQSPTMRIHITRTLKKDGTSASTEPLEAALRTCDLEEVKRFPYRLGQLEMTATYRGGEFQDLRQGGRYAFSDEFLGCLTQAFHSYRSNSDSDLTVKVSI